MKFILGKDRNQTEIICLDQLISEDNEVRLVLFSALQHPKNFHQ